MVNTYGIHVDVGTNILNTNNIFCYIKIRNNIELLF